MGDLATVTGFDVQVCVPLAASMARRVATEDEAVRLAGEWVGPNQSQVTITAHTEDAAGTFGIRHLVWRGGVVVDSRWSVWVAREFVGNRGCLGLPLGVCEVTP